MAPLTGVTMIKAFPYRDELEEEFSNTYHFRAAPPSTDADWMTLVNAVLAVEQTVFPPYVTFRRASCHATDNDSDPAVFSHDWTLTPPPPGGTFSANAADRPTAGDQAAFAWWKMDYKSTKGKPVYLRKFLHAAVCAPTGSVDLIAPDYAAAINSYAFEMNDTHGGLRSQGRDGGAVIYGHGPYITTRTLKRRGKKKKST